MRHVVNLTAFYFAMIALIPWSLVFGQSVSDSEGAFKYVATQPGMEWAYRVTTGPTSCILNVLAPVYAVEKKAGSVSLTFPQVSAWTKPGEPRLPVFPAVFELEQGVSYLIYVNPGEAGKKQIGYLDPVPTVGNVSETDDEGRVMEYLLPDASIYRTNAFWPAKFYTIDEAKGGGKRYLRVGIQSFQYNPWNQMLKYYSNLEVRISFNYSGEAATE